MSDLDNVVVTLGSSNWNKYRENYVTRVLDTDLVSSVPNDESNPNREEYVSMGNAYIGDINERI